MLALGLGACRAPVHARYEETLRDFGVRTVAVEEDLVLYSPYGAVRTQRYLDAAEDALDDLAQGLPGPGGPPILIVLSPLDVGGGGLQWDGDALRFEGAPARPSRRGVVGVAGSAGARDAALVFVPADRRLPLPDGRTITETFTFAGDLLTLRHELAHVAAARAGLGGPQWLDEALAILFEYGHVEDGLLVTGRDAETLVAARDLYGSTSLELLVGWEEPHADIAAGHFFAAGRPLAHALAVFFVEGAEGELNERVRALAALDADDLRALEPAFRAWLAAGTPPRRAGAEGEP